MKFPAPRNLKMCICHVLFCPNDCAGFYAQDHLLMMEVQRFFLVKEQATKQSENYCLAIAF